MARDIEEFLRRAAERRKQAQRGGGGQQRPPAQRSQAKRPTPPPPRQMIGEDDIVPAKLAFPKQQPHSIGEESVGDHVRRHLDVSDIAEHVDHLAEDIEQADERMDAHLDQVFEHDVGKLGSGKGATDELNRTTRSNKATSDLLKLLQNPASVRQAIIISEILKRPDFSDFE